MLILKAFLSLGAIMKVIHVVCKRKQAETCFLLAFYKLSDLYGRKLIKLHT